jgi:hypothetical protein
MMFFECVNWEDTSRGKLGFIMVFDEEEQRLHYYVGIGEGLNEQIDINHIFAGGYKLPTEAGMAIFFGAAE